MDSPSTSINPLYPPGYPAADITGSAASLRLFIPGKPVPKGRPRARAVSPKAGGKPWVQVYTDAATATWEDLVAMHAKAQILRIPRSDDGDITLPFDSRILATIRFNLERPKSLPRHVEFPMRSRSDIDNLVKSVLDGLQKARIIENDNIVTDLVAQKRFVDASHPLGVEVDLTTLM